MRRLLLALVFVGSVAFPAAAGVLYDTTGKHIECPDCGLSWSRCSKCYGMGRAVPLMMRRCSSCDGRGLYHWCPSAINQTPLD
jgi:hypothetical protein